MKNKLSCYMYSFAALLISSLLFSLLFSTLYYFAIISTAFFQQLCTIGGFLCFAISGAVFALYIEKKALLHAFVMVLFLAFPTLFITVGKPLNYLIVFAKLLTYIVVCMLIYTKRKKV